MSPLYEFQCMEHGRFETSCKHEGISEVRCPTCKGEVRRVYSPFNFTVGWRLTEESQIKGHKDEWEKDV